MKDMKIVFCGAKNAQVPAIVISILDFLFSSVVLGLLAYVTHMHSNKPDELEQTVQRIDPQRTGNLANFLQFSQTEQVILLVFPLVTYGVGLLMSIFLFVSAIKRHENALQVWFILTMIFMIFQIVVLIIQVSGGRQAWGFIVPPIIEFVYRIYALFIVRCLIIEINSVDDEEKSEDITEEAEVEAEAVE